MACWDYARRTGKARPEGLVIAKNLREFEADEERRLLREAARVVERDEHRRQARRN